MAISPGNLRRKHGKTRGDFSDIISSLTGKVNPFPTHPLGLFPLTSCGELCIVYLISEN